MSALSSHEGGGGWPGGVRGVPPGLSGGSLFGDGLYTGNIIQGGSVLMPQTHTAYIKLGLTSGMVSGTFNSLNATYLVDGNTTYAACYCGAAGQYIAFNLGVAVAVRKFRVYVGDAAPSLGQYRIDYSDDGVSWTPSGSALTDFATGPAWTEITWADCGAHQHWRVVSTLTPANSPWEREMELYSVQEVANAIVVTGAATVAPDASTLGGAALVPNLVVDGASAVLTLSGVANGLALLAAGSIRVLNGGKINVDSKALAGLAQADALTLAAPPLRGRISPRHHAFARQRNALALDGAMLFLASPSVLIDSGCIVSADGTSGNQNGGVVSIVYRDTYSSLGTVRANGYGAGAVGVVSINKV